MISPNYLFWKRIQSCDSGLAKIRRKLDKKINCIHDEPSSCKFLHQMGYNALLLVPGQKMVLC